MNFIGSTAYISDRTTAHKITDKSNSSDYSKRCKQITTILTLYHVSPPRAKENLEYPYHAVFSSLQSLLASFVETFSSSLGSQFHKLFY
jgi:hypothetical protein